MLRSIVSRRRSLAAPFGVAALAVGGTASGCESVSGVGVGTTTRWGGSGSSGPPIFVGGPSVR
jgi:hypothetical protein